jgi:hypothetical protein
MGNGIEIIEELGADMRQSKDLPTKRTTAAIALCGSRL